MTKLSHHHKTVSNQLLAANDRTARNALRCDSSGDLAWRVALATKALLLVLALVGLALLSGVFSWDQAQHQAKLSESQFTPARLDRARQTEREQSGNVPSGVSTRAIETIRVGDRVLAHNPEVAAAERQQWLEPDWSEWRHVSLVMPLPQSKDHTETAPSFLQIEILRPESWIREQIGFVVDEPAESSQQAVSDNFQHSGHQFPTDLPTELRSTTDQLQANLASTLGIDH